MQTQVAGHWFGDVFLQIQSFGVGKEYIFVYVNKGEYASLAMHNIYSLYTWQHSYTLLYKQRNNHGSLF